MKFLIIAGISLLTCSASSSQQIVLGCPLKNITLKDPNTSGPYHYDQKDKKIIMVSSTDTSFLSPFDGKVSTVEMGEGNKYEIVIYHGDYYVWLTGLTSALVKKNEVVKKGQPVATIHPNDEIEFLFFKNGTPVDPRSYLECNKQ